VADKQVKNVEKRSLGEVAQAVGPYVGQGVTGVVVGVTVAKLTGDKQAAPPPSPPVPPQDSGQQ
jgi:hypothetical protein